MKSKGEEDRAAELSEKLLFINASDATSVAPGVYHYHQYAETPFGKEYFEKLKLGGVNAIHISFLCWFYDDFYDSIKRVSHLYKLLERYPDDLKLVTDVSDVHEAKKQGKLALIMHFHNTSTIDDNIDLLGIHYKLGLRVLQLTYQSRNLVGEGTGEDNDGGLSGFGLRVIDEMNRLGILIDLAHSSYRTWTEALERSRDTVVCSHGCAYSLCDNKRNIKDDQIQALAEKGGVMGIMAKPTNLTSDGGAEGATLSDYMSHVEHVIELAGVDHVGIGIENGYGRTEEDYAIMVTEFKRHFVGAEQQHMLVPEKLDFEKGYSAEGLGDPAKVKINLIRELVKRGYSDQEIGKVMGENFIRVYSHVWK